MLLTVMFEPAKPQCFNQAIQVLLMHGFFTLHIHIQGCHKN